MILRLWICRKYQGVTPSKSLWHLRVARSLLWSYTHRNSLLVLATVTVSGGSSETPVGWQVWTPSHIRHLHSVQEVEKLVKQFKTKSDREAEQNRSLGLVEIDMSSIFPYSWSSNLPCNFQRIPAAKWRITVWRSPGRAAGPVLRPQDGYLNRTISGGAKDWARRDGDAFVGCRKKHFFKIQK